MTDPIPSSNLVNSKIFAPGGEVAGTIEELIIDPSTGIVRFATIRMNPGLSVLLPWAAMTFTKSQMGFTLTHLGVSLVEHDTS